MKTFILGLMLALSSMTAHALSLTDVNNAQYGFNRASPNMLQRYRLGDKLMKSQVLSMRSQYKFATQGGAVGTIPLIDPLTGLQAVLPQNAIVRDCIIDTTVALTSGGSPTIAINAQSAGDIKPATAMASYTGLLACVPVGTAATAFKLTADRPLTLTIATAALTAGAINVVINYEISEP